VKGVTAMNKRKAFTIVELLTSLVIIALLLALLLPSISAVRRHAKETAQKAQFATIEMALDAFKQDYGDLPPSGRLEAINPSAPGEQEYCGAMKLAEALLGWDLQGFHPKTAWRRDGYDSIAPLGNTTYDPLETRVPLNASLYERKGPYLELAKTSVFPIGTRGASEGLFRDPTPFTNSNKPYVLCDVFGVRKLKEPGGKMVLAGSPILYYRANTASKSLNDPLFANRIYNHWDNQDLLFLGKLTPSGVRGANHPLLHGGAGPTPSFYEAQFNYNLNAPPAPPNYGGSGIGFGIRDPKTSTALVPWPYNPDSYILISAGMDGLYGTADDIHNY
jgi:type II secretory pathway pseudopilin PulG